MIRRLHHVAVAVRSVDEALRVYAGALGLELVAAEEVEPEGVRVAMLRAPGGGPLLELVEPLREDSSVARFLERRGEGLHHIAFEVDDLEGAVAALRGRVTLVDDRPRRAAGGRRAVFVHPKSAHGVLVELVEEVR